MTAIAITAAQVEPIDVLNAEILPGVAAAAITKGQALYLLDAGTYGVADANDSGKQQIRGIALNAAAAGGAVSVFKRGPIAGFTVSGLNADALVYLSDTAGALDTAAGTLTVQCGRVIVMSNVDTSTKVLYFTADWQREWV